MKHFKLKFNRKYACACIMQLMMFFIFIKTSSTNAQSIILGRPTDVSITASVLFYYNANFYFVYGTQPGIYTDSTIVLSNTANNPFEVDIQNLTGNTQYFYRMLYRPAGTGNYTQTAEYKFHTQRAQGSTFTFTVEADEHLYDIKGVKSMYAITLDNQLKDNPDFMISLGDIFGDDHTPTTTTQQDMDSLHHDYIPFLSQVCHSVPFYVCLGNHEGENDYYLNQTPPNNIATYGTLARKFYYPNPYPNSFYTGDTISEGFGINLPENYYAWTWGDALFVVLDVYRTECHDSLMPKPQKWNWTLGDTQYFWLLNTLQNSTAKYKFVFAHHNRGQGRGGKTQARYYEWGGYEDDSVTYNFPTRRPGWPMPIHQMFINYGVNIFFQGHDHLYAHELVDSVTYQEVPMAADSTYEIGMLANADAYTADTLDGSGHLRVVVNPNCVTVDFVRAYLPADTVSGLHHNREVPLSYNVGCTTGINETNIENRIVAYPNPANDFIKVLLPNEIKNYTIELNDAIGRLITKTKSNSIDVRNYHDGIYFIIIKTETNQFNKKVIINH